MELDGAAPRKRRKTRVGEDWPRRRDSGGGASIGGGWGFGTLLPEEDVVAAVEPADNEEDEELARDAGGVSVQRFAEGYEQF